MAQVGLFVDGEESQATSGETIVDPATGGVEPPY